MQVRSEEERQSGSSSGCAGRLRVHRTACSSDLSCRKSRWPSLGRLLCARFMSIEHDAFFSFYRPQMGARIKNGLGGLLPTTATGLAYFWAWDQKPRTARCRMRDRRGSLSTAPLFASEEGLSATQIDRAPPSPLAHDYEDCLRELLLQHADRVAMHGLRAFLVGQRPSGPSSKALRQGRRRYSGRVFF